MTGTTPVIKRNLCKFFQEGLCEKGAACGFAHGESEIGQMGIAQVGRTICRFFSSGLCERGPSCGFRHISGDPEGAASLLAPGGALAALVHPGAGAAAGPLGQLASLGGGRMVIKRNMCKFYPEGLCEKGGMCGFAHSAEELGTPAIGAMAAAVVPGLKRSLCRFNQQGMCEKGSKCTFAHSMEEIGTVAGSTTAPKLDLMNHFTAPGQTPAGQDLSADPSTGAVYDAATGAVYDAASGAIYDATTGAVYDPQSGAVYDAASGTVYDANTGALYDATTGQLYDSAAVAGTAPAPADSASGADSSLALYDPLAGMDPLACAPFGTDPLALGGSSAGSYDPLSLAAGTMPQVVPPPQVIQPPAKTGIVKRTLCKFYQEGLCEKGAGCTFAHSITELGTLSAASAPNSSAVPHGMQVKRTICRFYAQGSCQQGPQCGFAHGPEEIGTMVPQQSSPPPFFGGSKGGGESYRAAAPAVKRTLCKFHEQNPGGCSKGSHCGFAHGTEEIGQPLGPRVDAWAGKGGGFGKRSAPVAVDPVIAAGLQSLVAPSSAPTAQQHAQRALMREAADEVQARIKRTRWETSRDHPQAALQGDSAWQGFLPADPPPGPQPVVVPPPTVIPPPDRDVGQGVAKRYSGKFEHPQFGPSPIPMFVELYGDVTTATEGHWVTNGQKEEIQVANHSGTITLSDAQTELEGFADANGTISGQVVQLGDRSGWFELQPLKRPGE